MSSFDPSTRITLPREELLQFLGKMALPPWRHADGSMCRGDVDSAPIATEIADWLEGNEIHAVADPSPTTDFTNLATKLLAAVADLLPFGGVECFTGDDGEGYYTLIYRNGERGPRSEGYADGLVGAVDAAQRDFGLLLPVVERTEHLGEGARHGDG